MSASVQNNAVVNYAFRFLQFAFVVLPIVAGVDKFFNGLVSWEAYLSPYALTVLGDNYIIFMLCAGVIEVIAGIGNLFLPRLFAFITGLWLLLIMINLFMGGYHDIAIRDFALAFSAFALGMLAIAHKKK